jgi:hypothetical protein
LAWLLCLVTWFLIVLVDVEAVVITGPGIFAVGLLLALLGYRAKYISAAVLGAAYMAICLLFTALVNIFHWSPGAAEAPFTWMGAVFLFVTLPYALWARSHAPPCYHPWQCARCGYLLYGLSEPRCPECGSPFDPRRFEEPAGYRD